MVANESIVNVFFFLLFMPVSSMSVVVISCFNLTLRFLMSVLFIPVPVYMPSALLLLENNASENLGP